MRSSSSLVKIVIMIPRNEDINHTHDPHIRATRIFPSRRSCFSLPSSRIPKKKGGGGKEKRKEEERKKPRRLVTRSPEELNARIFLRPIEKFRKFSQSRGAYVARVRKRQGRKGGREGEFTPLPPPPPLPLRPSCSGRQS